MTIQNLVWISKTLSSSVCAMIVTPLALLYAMDNVPSYETSDGNLDKQRVQTSNGEERKLQEYKKLCGGPALQFLSQPFSSFFEIYRSEKDKRGSFAKCESVEGGNPNEIPTKVGEFGSSGIIFKDQLEVMAVGDPKIRGVTIHIARIKRPITDRLRRGKKNFKSEFVPCLIVKANALPQSFQMMIQSRSSIHTRDCDPSYN